MLWEEDRAEAEQDVPPASSPLHACRLPARPLSRTRWRPCHREMRDGLLVARSREDVRSGTPVPQLGGHLVTLDDFSPRRAAKGDGRPLATTRLQRTAGED